MAAIVDMTGRIYGRLTVTSYSKPSKRVPKGGISWLCNCSCGNICWVFGPRLRTGNTKSCGCLQVDSRRTSNLTHGHAGKGKRSREYRSWAHARERCTNPKCCDFRHYGGRGIVFCDRWLNSFENFLADMGPAPKNTSIDRINNSGDYEPGNCRWATRTQQARNRRGVPLYNINGRSLTLPEIGNLLDLSTSAIGHHRRRLKSTEAFTDYVHLRLVEGR